ncbi:olfactory receptor 2H2-like [Saccopteryx leptura]|uniref:olfactory receptor 2H2-like n=1 Tax=Saccopteryx leptura TaxID=249018 RepID=UPI00339C277D
MTCQAKKDKYCVLSFTHGIQNSCTVNTRCGFRGLEGRVLDNPKLEVALSVFVSILYMVTLVRNTIIILVFHLSHPLYTSMSFFFSYLPLLDFCFTSTCSDACQPLEMHKIISHLRCAVQLYIFLRLRAAAGHHLSALCGHDVWHLGAIVYHHEASPLPSLLGGQVFRVSALTHLTYGDTRVIKPQISVVNMIFPVGWFVLILVSKDTSWGSAGHAVPRGEEQGFKTCSSHLAIELLFYYSITGG